MDTKKSQNPTSSLQDLGFAGISTFSLWKTLWIMWKTPPAGCMGSCHFLHIYVNWILRDSFSYNKF